VVLNWRCSSTFLFLLFLASPLEFHLGKRLHTCNTDLPRLVEIQILSRGKVSSFPPFFTFMWIDAFSGNSPACPLSTTSQLSLRHQYWNTACLLTLPITQICQITSKKYPPSFSSSNFLPANNTFASPSSKTLPGHQRSHYFQPSQSFISFILHLSLYSFKLITCCLSLLLWRQNCLTMT